MRTPKQIARQIAGGYLGITSEREINILERTAELAFAECEKTHKPRITITKEAERDVSEWVEEWKQAGRQELAQKFLDIEFDRFGKGDILPSWARSICEKETAKAIPVLEEQGLCPKHIANPDQEGAQNCDKCNLPVADIPKCSCGAVATHINEPDPHNEEINGDSTLMNMCDKCFRDSLDDI